MLEKLFKILIKRVYIMESKFKKRKGVSDILPVNIIYLIIFIITVTITLYFIMRTTKNVMNVVHNDIWSNINIIKSALVTIGHIISSKFL